MKGMDKERQMIRDVAAKTAQKVVQPRVAEIEATGEFPWDLVDVFGKQGLLSLLLPEEYGGTNGDLTSFCLVIEEIAKVSASSALLILAQGTGSAPLWLGGDASQQERYFTRMTDRSGLAAFALGEQGPGSDVSFVKIRAERKGNDTILNGRQGFIANGSVAEIYTVFASDPSRPGPEGISAFLVEKGAGGISFGPKEDLLGMRGAVFTEVLLENCRVAGTHRLGEEGHGWDLAKKTLTYSRPASGALAVGLAQGAMDFALQYGSERVQFGKPIASFQAIQFMIADMATQIEAARALVYKTADQAGAGTDGLEHLAAATKCYATDMAMKVTTDAVQILGGYGYMKDYPVERMMRDAKVMQVFGGSNQIQKQTIARLMFQDRI